MEEWGAKGLPEAPEEIGTRLWQTVDSFHREAKKCVLYPEGNREPLKVSEQGQEKI